MTPSYALLALLLVLTSATAWAQAALVPLTDLGTGRYHGYEGGLYPGGVNDLPGAHLERGIAALERIRPRNAAGDVDTVDGRIVLLSIGMSNATQEFSAFKALADADTLKSGRVVIVDGAQGGQTASIIAADTARFWSVVDERLAQAGVTRAQVQVAWLKEANARPTGSFPGHADTLSMQLERIARILHARFPNMAATYLASRTYGGYATTTLNPEPYAYESGFAVRWLIERQIAGDSALLIDGPKAGAPWLAWGPYLWANGMTPRGDGLTWAREDFVNDGTHPSTSGRAKVARMLLSFFQTDTLASQWYLRSAWEPVAVALPAAPRLVSPADSSILAAGPIDFVWQSPAGPVDRYMVEIIGSGGYRFADSSVTAAPYRWSQPARVGLHLWRVRAHNSAGWGEPSAARVFVLEPPSAVGEDHVGAPSELDLR